MPEWDADLEIDGPLVRSLLTEQFPELDAASARLLGEGWDNSVWVVEEQWVFRIPRRRIAIPGVERELAVLPRIAPLLPVPIPLPTFVGRPGERFPWPFFGAPLLAGREPADAALGGEDRAELGAELGRFLRVVHDLEIDVDLPVDPLGRADMAKRLPMARQLLSDIGWRKRGRGEPSLFARAADLRASRRTTFLHGDLHLRHVLVEGPSLAGVIDWGDTCLGDPSIDLQIAWSLLPVDARARFFEAYGPVDEETELRARVLAASLCAMLAKYAKAVGHATLERESVAGLERTLVD